LIFDRSSLAPFYLVETGMKENYISLIAVGTYEIDLVDVSILIENEKSKSNFEV